MNTFKPPPSDWGQELDSYFANAVYKLFNICLIKVGTHVWSNGTGVGHMLLLALLWRLWTSLFVVFFWCCIMYLRGCSIIIWTRFGTGRTALLTCAVDQLFPWMHEPLNKHLLLKCTPPSQMNTTFSTLCYSRVFYSAFCYIYTVYQF